MADIYQHNLVRFSDGGLNLRLPPDLIPPGQYSKLTNALPVIEGRLEARSPLNFLVNVPNTTSPGSGLHSLTRLNQLSVAGVGDRIAGVDTTVQTFALPAGNVATSRDTSRTGDPLSLATFHFNNDSAAWSIISDRAGMKKYKGLPGGGGTYVNLGILSPALQDPSNMATAIDGGAGNLNNGSGPGYDWVYTYVNTTTLTESNPSDQNITPSYNQAPGTLTTPDPGFGGPNSGTGFTISASSAAETRQSANASNYSATPNVMVFLRLYVTATVNNHLGTTGGCCFGCFEASLDSGKSWKLLTDSVAYLPTGPGVLHVVFSLPTTQDMTKFQVRAVVLGVGNTTTPQNVTYRRIRDRAGNFNVNDLLTGGGGNATIALSVVSLGVVGVDITQTVTTLALTNRKANVSVLASTDPQVDAIRLYRRGGSVTASWAFVGQFTVAPNSGLNVLVDNVADSNLGGFVALNNDAPVTSVFANNRPLPYIWGPGFNPSRLFGCGDPDRPDAVYFSNPGNGDQWDASGWVDTSSPSDPMQNGCTFNTRVFAFSKERMYEIVPAVVGGAMFQPFETECRRGLISPYGLLSTARAIYFVAKDGIYVTTGGPEQSLVENDLKPLFPTYDAPQGRQVEGYDLINFERIEDIRLRFHNDEIYFIYRGLNNGNLQMFVYDQNKNRWRAPSYPVNIAMIYSEEAGPASSLLLGDSTGSMYNTTTNSGDALSGSTSNIPVTIQTGAYDQGMPLNLKEYGNVLFDIDPGGATLALPVTITPLLNGETITGSSLTITGTGRQQVPLSLSDVFGYNIEFRLTFSRNASINPVLYQFDILWRPEPVAVTHWEARENSYGMPGYWHIRDMYVALRSTSVVNLTVTIDNGTPIVLPIASTGGKRQKIYLPFPANKGRLYKFSLDSADGVSQFRVYVEDWEMRAKPWLTNLGYATIRAIGGETALVSPAFEGRVLSGG